VDFAGGAWLGDERQARDEFDRRVAELARQRREDRLFRLELIVDGEVAEERLVATGEIVRGDLLDSVSLTYLGVVTAIALALGFGIGGWLGLWVGLIGSGAVIGAIRIPFVRRAIVGFARWALGGNETRP
jgi:hypothetical protein